MGGVVVRVLAVVAIGLLLAVAAIWVFQRRLIYLPAGSPGAPPPGWEGADLETADGLALGAWHRPPAGDGPVVVVFNGNAGNRGGRIGLGERLAAEGLGVLLFDYRGYGGNPGSPSEAGLALDARAAADWVAEQYPGRDVVYFGESLGAAVAVELAVERPPAALALRSPFTSLRDAASVHYPFLPVGLLLWDDYPSLDRIDSVEAPVTVVAGSADSIIPVEQSRAVYDAAANPAEWIVVEGADHNDPALADGPEVVSAVLRLLS